MLKPPLFIVIITHSYDTVHYVIAFQTSPLYFRNVFRILSFPESISRNPISYFPSRFIVLPYDTRQVNLSIDTHRFHRFVESLFIYLSVESDRMIERPDARTVNRSNRRAVDWSNGRMVETTGLSIHQFVDLSICRVVDPSPRQAASFINFSLCS